MDFKIDPPSGHANSYYDVKFDVQFNGTERAEIMFVNKTTGKQIEIVATNAGYIQNNILIVKNDSTAEGYISLFSDKMNSELDNFSNIDITCHITSLLGDKNSKEKSTATFYNEDKSLDRDIIPFELVLDTNFVDVQHSVPLMMNIISEEEKKYEIVIKSAISTLPVCMFEVLARKGETKVCLPSPIIYSDLNLKNNIDHTYQLHYVKYQGLTPEGYVNRINIPITDTHLEFRRGEIQLEPQNRLSPDGSELSKDFVLSDRYFVHTYKEFSSFGRRNENLEIICNLARFTHEVQEMRENNKIPLANQADEREVGKVEKHRAMIRQEAYKKDTNKFFVHHNPDAKKRNFLNRVTPSIIGKSSKFVDPKLAGHPIKSSDCGCKRKKHA